MRRKIFLLSVTFIVSAFSTEALADIRGRVTDKAGGEPLEYVTVALRQTDSTLVAGVTTDGDGTFLLKSPEGKYTIEASMLGYRMYSSSVTSPGEIEIGLEVESSEIAAARVNERMKLVEVKMDKLVVNVAQSSFAQGTNGYELLKKAPGITIDKDGNIKLNGKSVSIWIDGRPSYLDGESLVSMLKGTLGNTIEKFEIMEHPSSKYDAAGQGGIINIKTKRNFALGLNASLGVNAGGMYFGKGVDRFFFNEDSFINLSYRGKKTNTFLNLYQNQYEIAGIKDNVTKQDVSGKSLETDAHSIHYLNGNYWHVKLGNDWYINDKDILGVIVSFPGQTGKNLSYPDSNVSVMSVDGERVETCTSNISNTNRQTQLTANLNYTHTFDASKASEITANLDWYRNTSPARNYQKNVSTPEDDKENPQTVERRIVSDNIVNIYSAKADFQTLFWKTGMLEAGVKWAMSVTDHNNTREETGLESVNTAFLYTEHIAAAYVSAAKQFNQKWSAKIGLRGEYTNSLGDWTSEGTSTRRSYFSLFPTAYVGFSPSQKANISLSYTRRISRPGYYSMNPAESYIDAHTINRGNPEIKPAFTHSVKISSAIFQYFSFSAGYDYTSDMINQIPSYTPDGDQIFTYGNCGINHNASLSANMSSFPVAKWFDWTVSLTGLYSRNILSGSLFNNDGFSFFGYTCLTFNLPKDWKIDLDGYCTTPRHWGNFRISSNGVANFGLKKMLLDGKLTLSLNVEDLLRSSKQCLTIVGIEGVSSSIDQHYCVQSVKLGLTWNFGQGKAQTKYRKVGVLEESSRDGSGESFGKK